LRAIRRYTDTYCSGDSNSDSNSYCNGDSNTSTTNSPDPEESTNAAAAPVVASSPNKTRCGPNHKSGALHLQDLGFFVFEMIVDRFHEAIGKLLHFILNITQAVLG